MIPDDFKQQLLSRVDIVDVIERHVPLRKAGQNFVARCPFHSEKTPSFSVSPGKQFYHCFGCGAHGNAISFVMEHAGLGYVEAVKELAGMVGMSLPESRPNAVPQNGAPEADLRATLLAAARFYKACLKRSDAAIAYLKQRGVSGEIAARFGLGYAPAGWQSLAEAFPDYRSSAALKDAGLVVDGENGRRYDRFRDRIMFPITDPRGNVIGFGARVFGEAAQEGPKYLNSPETALFQKGQELFGLYQARPAVRRHGRIVVVEGYMDVVSLHQHGVDYAVATLGTSTTPVHVAKLLKLADEVYFCFDGDDAGRKAAWRALENALDQLVDGKQLSFMFFPEGEDPDSYVRRCAADDVWTALPLSELMARELSRQVDLETVEGRAKLLQLAGPLVRKVPAPAFQLQLRRRFAKLAEVTVPELEELFGLRPVVSSPGAARRTGLARSPAMLSLTRWILHAVLNDPSLAARVEPAELDATDRFHPALCGVLELLARCPELGARDICAAAIEAARDGATAGLLREAHAEVLASEKVVSAAEFESALRTLRDRVERRRITELIAKAGRSAEEAEELERLKERVSQRAKQPAESILSSV
ncbi:MAG: DNA primase [Burkholderiales bacterium]|nr:DNA primase [Burkholderiales bacterium]